MLSKAAYAEHYRFCEVPGFRRTLLMDAEAAALPRIKKTEKEKN